MNYDLQQNEDSEMIQTSLGPIQIRKSTLQHHSQREYDLPSDVFDQAVAIIATGLHLTEVGTRSFMIDVLREFSYFKALETQNEYFDYIDQFLASVEHFYVRKGQFVFHCGDQGDYFYLILKGSVNVYAPKKDEELNRHRSLLQRLEHLKENLKHSVFSSEIKQYQKEIALLNQQLQELQHPDDLMLHNAKNRYFQKVGQTQQMCTYKKVNVMKQSECFGEVSLFRNEARAATLIATEPLHLAALNKKNYLRIFGQKLEKLNFTLGMLSKTFPDAPKEIVVQLSFDFVKKKYSINQVLFKEGDPIDGFYLIFVGCVETVSQNIKVGQFGDGQFVGLFDFSNPSTRTYTATSMSHETIVYFLANKYTVHLDKIMRKTLLDQQKVSELYRLNWVQRCTNMIRQGERKDNQQMLSQVSIRPKEVLQMYLNTTKMKPRAPTMSEDRIQMIMQYNNNLHSKTEKLGDTIKLCLQMKDFDKEREFQAKQMVKNRNSQLPRLRTRPINVQEAYSTLFQNRTPTDYNSNTDRIRENNKIHNIHNIQNIQNIQKLRKKKSAS